MSSAEMDTDAGAGSIVTGLATLFTGIGAIINHGAVHDGVAQAITEPGLEKVAQAFVWGLEIGTALAFLFLFAAIMVLIGGAMQ